MFQLLHRVLESRQVLHRGGFVVKRLDGFSRLNNCVNVLPARLKRDSILGSELLPQLFDPLLGLEELVFALLLPQLLDELLVDVLAITFVDRSEPWIPLQTPRYIIVAAQVVELSALRLEQLDEVLASLHLLLQHLLLLGVLQLANVVLQAILAISHSSEHLDPFVVLGDPIDVFPLPGDSDAEI